MKAIPMFVVLGFALFAAPTLSVMYPQQGRPQQSGY